MSKLFPTIDEFECPHYKCMDCIHFKHRHFGGCQHRFDNTKMQYAFLFNSSQEEVGALCNDFEPNGIYKAAIPYWHGIKHYREWLHKQDVEDLKECGWTEERINWKFECSKQRDFVIFELDQEPNVRYYVPGNLYRTGTMWDGNKLLAVKRGYYKRDSIKHGVRLYKWIKEDIDGVIVE